MFNEVDFENQPLISTKWVLTEKSKNGVKVTKARLVAKGFEETLCESRRDSPTCLKENLRLVMAVAACFSWTVFSLDVKSAFLQGKQIDRSVCLKPPAEADTTSVWELNKPLYGLCDASRKWYLRVKEVLEALRE